jgi:hypothetical protein
VAKTNKPIPAHVVANRAQQKRKRTRPYRPGRAGAEPHDVFRRINMHDGDRTVCWEWRGAHGRGTRDEWRPRVVIGMKDYYVYRVVYELYTGYKLQRDDVIRHNCDNPWCCNPFHMTIGKQVDNVADMLKRERVGMKHFHVKRIMQMLEIGCSAAFVCVKMKEGYNMSLDVSVIRKIRMRRVYKHIPWEWGDRHAADRRIRLAGLKQARLAGSSACDTITTLTQATEKQDG